MADVFRDTRLEAARQLGARPLPLLGSEVAEYQQRRQRRADIRWIVMATLDLALIAGALTVLTGVMAWLIGKLPPL